ncbi:alpha/beta fold hydrolase [Pontibacter silvestris]|uniref:Alpha/beta fold hydrolase n=1 Tax=Pontibacter silvestris TaxID=2305183 RepID=A0ABW4X110_9BACT|nr:alpha/beta hydrolase [Pontibacter silvestris]MCC9135949.1 alpha/beta hydrolase [Pontibacter silvestris]
MDVREKEYLVNGISLHVAESGKAEGDLILFLHGFPEFSYGWNKQLAYFSEKGFRAVAPDQRGYNLSSKPSGVESYTIKNLTDDIVALIRQLTDRKVYLVGHDWGGAVAWTLAMLHPQLLEKLIVLNMPHPAVMKENLKKNPKQMLMSWYTGFFQLPALPEFVSGAFDHEMLKKSMLSTANDNTFSEDDLAHYKEAWEQPEALTNMINWYRAYKLSEFDLNEDVSIPTLIIWGKKDKFLNQGMAAQSIIRCKDGRLLALEDATHWLHHEKPDLVNKAILYFVQQE